MGVPATNRAILHTARFERISARSARVGSEGERGREGGRKGEEMQLCEAGKALREEGEEDDYARV